MRQTLPVSYVRIWCQKNQAVVTCQTTASDSYQIDANGIWLLVDQGGPAPVNPRQVFPVVNRFPSLQASALVSVAQGRPLYLNMRKAADKIFRPISFDQIADEVESYLSLLKDIDLVSFYVAVRAYETGLVSLPQLNRVATNLAPGQTLGGALLGQRLCEWDDLLAVCLDLEPATRGKKTPSSKTSGGFELCGEILVALGKVTRSQLESALRIKRRGSRPLGEILIEMGACTAGDIETCLHTQDQMRTPANDGIGLIGDLLVEQGKVSREDLYEALRLQKAARQPLDQLLVSMGAISQQFVQEFRWRVPEAVDPQGRINEDMLARFLLQQNMVSEHQLTEAAHLQKRGRQLIGELLVGLKLCSQQEIETALSAQKNMRQAPQRGPDKLGQILIQRRIVMPELVEQASKVQRLGREKLGATLISLGACTQVDFADALEIQFTWRESLQTAEDKLGNELLKTGAISSDNLTRALDLHSRAGKPLGEILVEQGACTPEVVIDTLIRRDERRRQAFLDFLSSQAGSAQGDADGGAERAKPATGDARKPGLLGRMSSLFKRSGS